MNPLILKPFTTGFLSEFILTPETLPFRDDEIMSLDAELSVFEQVFLNPDIEKNLISKNELLASFAISKAENSQLSLREAEEVYELIQNDPNYEFIHEKIKSKTKLTQKDHDRLEFLNILRTFRSVNQATFTMKDLTPEFIRKVHAQLTQGLDIFNDHLPDFTVYKSGAWRNNNMIRVGKYNPAPHIQVENSVLELTKWLKKNQTITGVATFHTALYAVHPFNNGNKRVCRILEHILLRSLKIDSKHLYSTSYYYHKHKDRYYRCLLYSLDRKNLNHFVAYVQEALVLSIIDVVKTSLEAKRGDYISQKNPDKELAIVLKHFIKQGDIQFKKLTVLTQGKIARQTLVTYLARSVEHGILTKREQGRTTHYTLNFDAPESKYLQKWLAFAQERLKVLPYSITLF